MNIQQQNVVRKCFGELIVAHIKLQPWSSGAPWVLDATSSWMDSLLVSHQLPSLLLLFSVLKSINWAPPALLPTSPLSCSSLLCLHTEGFPWASWALGKHTLPGSLYQQVIVGACPTPCILKSVANTQQFVFLCSVVLRIFCLSFLSLSSCQVDISFISQEVFDRSFYEEMYPPAAPATTAQPPLDRFVPILSFFFFFIQVVWAAHKHFSFSLPAIVPLHFTKSFVFF